MTTDIRVPVDWSPWEHQHKLWNAMMNDGVKRACVVWHRRAGKDHTGINMCAVSMFRRPGIYWHLLPTYTQGQKVIWNGMDNQGRKFIDYIPKEAENRRRNDDMLIEFKPEVGGALYQVIGSDQPDRIVGPNPFGVVFSEYSLMNPLGWNLIRPVLNANDGWALFIFTARGYNHAWRLLQAAKENPAKWFSEVLDITMTRRPDGRPIVTEEDVAEEIAEGMPEELARQEYYCDFSAPLVGAYYGKELEQADRDGRVKADLVWDKRYQVNTCWDLGIRDTMVVWFFQIVDGWIHWIDYEAGVGAGIEHYAKVLDQKPYVYKAHYAPHDVSKREIGTGTSILETAAGLGLRFTPVARTRSVDDDINACRLVIARSRFNSETCAPGIEALRHYRKEWNEKNRVWSAKPVHDWTSHPADAFRTGAVAMPRLAYTVKEPPRYSFDQTFDEVLAEHDRLSAAKRGQSDVRRL